MKLVRFSFIYLCQVIFLMTLIQSMSSCKQDDPLQAQIDLEDKTLEATFSKDPEVVSFQGARTLKFSNVEHYQQFASSLMQCSQKEQLQLMKQYGVETELSLLYDCKAQIKSLLNSTQGRNDFESNYKSIQNQYSDRLLFNDMDDACIYPEVRAKNVIEAAIANISGIYIIGNDPVHIEKYNSYLDRLNDHNIQRIEVDLNELDNGLRNTAYKKNSSRKVIAELSRDIKNKAVYLKCSAQKKVLFWWDEYDTNIHTEMDLRVNVLFDVPDPIIKIKTPIMTFKIDNFTVELEDPFNIKERRPAPFKLAPENQYKVFTNMYEVDNQTRLLGVFSLPDAHENPSAGIRPKIEGHMKVWSRGISYEGAGETHINLEF